MEKSVHHLLKLIAIILLAGIFGSAQTSSKNITFAVFDGDAQTVKGIQTADVRLRIGKKDVPIDSINEMSDQGLDLIVLLDRSISQETGIDRQKDAVRALLQNRLKPGLDRVAIGSFAGTLTLHSDLSDDLKSSVNVLPTIVIEYPPGHTSIPRGGVVSVPPGGASQLASIAGTAIWDSIFDSAKALGSAASGVRRKVILVFSDGFNTAGSRKRDEAVTQAASSGVAIFFVGIGDPKFADVDRKSLSRFAEESGGYTLFPNRKLADLNEVSMRVVDLMRNSYSLTHAATAASGDIQISLPKRKGLSVSHHIQ